MAVLHLLLQHDPAPGRTEAWREVCVKHGWVEGKKFLLVPYHMIGARNMESAILGGYVDHVRRAPPRRPLPGVYLADDLFDDARRTARTPRRREVLRRAQPGRPAASRWGKLGRGWTAARFEAALAAPPGDDTARPAGRRPGQAPLPRLPGRLGRGKDRVVPVARQGPERHQPPRQGRWATTP